MIPEEQRAMTALGKVSMRIASPGKRFRRDIQWLMEYVPDFKMTKNQALYMWFLCDMYRRQIKDEEILRWAEYRKLYGELPPIYLEGDHREPIQRKSKKAREVQSVETATPCCAEGHAKERQISLW
jgi:hypothetical protein